MRLARMNRTGSALDIEAGELERVSGAPQRGGLVKGRQGAGKVEDGRLTFKVENLPFGRSSSLIFSLIK